MGKREGQGAVSEGKGLFLAQGDGGAEGIGGNNEDFSIHMPLLPLSVLTGKFQTS